ncbi:MAG: hypothetical protein ACYTGV_14055 [Planctomycetota bacterium]|jgi:hypothetical protein
MSHGIFLRNIQRSTQFLTRRRRRTGTRHFERSGIVRPLAGGGRRTERRAGFVSLALPGAAVTFLGLAAQPAKDILSASPTSLLFWGLSIIFSVRALSSDAPRPVRALAGLICLGYPICALLVAIGILS